MVVLHHTLDDVDPGFVYMQLHRLVGNSKLGAILQYLSKLNKYARSMIARLVERQAFNNNGSE